MMGTVEAYAPPEKTASVQLNGLEQFFGVQATLTAALKLVISGWLYYNHISLLEVYIRKEFQIIIWK